jgi:hypothetical protein
MAIFIIKIFQMTIYCISANFIVLLAESKFPVKTKTIAADFSKGQPVFDVIEQELKDIPVGILGTVLMTSFV